MVLPSFQLRFPDHEIAKWGGLYDYPGEEDLIAGPVAVARRVGYLPMDTFMQIGDWKSPRVAFETRRESARFRGRDHAACAVAGDVAAARHRRAHPAFGRELAHRIGDPAPLSHPTVSRFGLPCALEPFDGGSGLQLYVLGFLHGIHARHGVSP